MLFRKNPGLTWRPILQLALSLHLDFSIINSISLISPVWILSPWGCSSSHTNYPWSLYHFHTLLLFPKYTYQVSLFSFIRQISCTLCFLSSLTRPHDLLIVILYYFVYYLFLSSASSGYISRYIFCILLPFYFTTACFLK